MRRTVRKAVTAIMVAVLMAAPAAAHTFYAALTRISYNASAETIEVVHRLATHDMEAVLSFHEGERLSFDRFQTTGALAGAYLKSRFAVTVNARALSLSFLGIETEGEDLWAYFEAPAPSPPFEFEVEDRIFLEELPGQVNTLVLTIGDERASAQLNAEQPGFTAHFTP